MYATNRKLVKVGNIKIGELRKGTPITREGLLVTRAVKDNEEEHFLPFEPFTRQGVDKLEIILPFDSPKANFEVGFVSFANIQLTQSDDSPYIPYIIKEYEDKGHSLIIAQPLSEYFEGEDAPYILFGENSPSLIEELRMKYSGFLRCMIKGISGFNEVFHFTTHSKATINAINSQLAFIDSLTGGKTAGLVLEMKAFRKQYKEKVFPFIDIAIPAATTQEMARILKEHLESREFLTEFADDSSKEEESLIPSLFEFVNFDKEKMQIQFEEFDEVIHQLSSDDDETAPAATKAIFSKASLDSFADELIANESFKLRENYKSLLKTMISRVSSKVETEEEAKTKVVAELEATVANKGTVLLKDIADVIKKYTD